MQIPLKLLYETETQIEKILVANECELSKSFLEYNDKNIQWTVQWKGEGVSRKITSLFSITGDDREAFVQLNCEEMIRAVGTSFGIDVYTEEFREFFHYPYKVDIASFFLQDFYHEQVQPTAIDRAGNGRRHGRTGTSPVHSGPIHTTPGHCAGSRFATSNDDGSTSRSPTNGRSIQSSPVASASDSRQCRSKRLAMLIPRGRGWEVSLSLFPPLSFYEGVIDNAVGNL